MPSVGRLALPALLVALALVLACGDATTPQTGLVRGTVTRVFSSEAVADARVELDGESTTTDTQGRFQFDQVERGAATLRVSADSYQVLARAIEVREFQSFALELSPLDTLVDVSGQVVHRIDGPKRVRLDHGTGSLWTDGDGRWSLADATLGPLALSIDHPSYNPYSTEVLVHSEGQEFVQTLTRDTTVTWWIDHDSYVFMRDDSLNANRGHVPVLLVTEDLGRTAVFALTPPALGYPWAELVGASLELHVRREAVDDEDPGDPRDLSVQLFGLDAPFLEGAVDFYNRPGFHLRDEATMTLAAGPALQWVSLDVLDVIHATPASFWATGIGIGTDVEQPVIRILSHDHGMDGPEIEDRPRATYRLRI